MQIRKSAGRRRVIARGAPARRVLLIEDDAVVRTILYEHLEEVGYRTDLATNGEEAIDYLAQIMLGDSSPRAAVKASSSSSMEWPVHWYVTQPDAAARGTPRLAVHRRNGRVSRKTITSV